MKIRRNTFVVATAALLITVAGCSSSEDSSSRVKNAALPAEPVLINGSFSKGGKGWNLGRSNALVGDGCAVGTSGDPSMGKLAYIHAAACKLPIESLNLSSGLQLCLLARSTNRLSVTLVPTKGFCRS